MGKICSGRAKCLQFTLTSDDLDEVRQLLLEFYEHYER